MRIFETYNFENQTTYGITGEIKAATLLSSRKLAVANDSYVELVDIKERQQHSINQNIQPKNLSLTSLLYLKNEENLNKSDCKIGIEVSTETFVKHNSVSDHKLKKQMFATVGDINELHFCNKGNYLLSLEKITFSGNNNDDCYQNQKQMNNEFKSQWKVLVYTNVLKYFETCSSANKYDIPLIVPRIATKVTPTPHAINRIEVIELQLRKQPDNVSCCQETGNILINSDCNLFLFSYRECSNDHQHFKYIDFVQFPFYLELNFRVKQISLMENVIACTSPNKCVVFKVFESKRPIMDGTNVLMKNDIKNWSVKQEKSNDFVTQELQFCNVSKTHEKRKNVIPKKNMSHKCIKNYNFYNCSSNYKSHKERDYEIESLVTKHANNYKNNKICRNKDNIDYKSLIDTSELEDYKLLSTNDPISKTRKQFEILSLSEYSKNPSNFGNIKIEDYPIQSNDVDVKLIDESDYNYIEGDSSNKANHKKFEIKKLLQISMASLKYSQFVKIPENFTCFDLKGIYKTQENNSEPVSDTNEQKSFVNLMQSKRYRNCIGFSFIITTTAADGYLYQFCSSDEWNKENLKPITKYQFTAQIISIIISDFVVHAVTKETVETVTSRVGHKLFSSSKEYPMLSNPFPCESAPTTNMQIFCMKLHSFCNIKYVLKTNGYLVLIAKCPKEYCSKVISNNIIDSYIASSLNTAYQLNNIKKVSVENGSQLCNQTETSAIELLSSKQSTQINSKSINCETISTYDANFQNLVSQKQVSQNNCATNILSNKYFQFNTTIKKKANKRNYKEFQNKVMKQDPVEWTVYNLKMPDAIRLSNDLELSAKETLQNVNKTFCKLSEHENSEFFSKNSTNSFDDKQLQFNNNDNSSKVISSKNSINNQKCLTKISVTYDLVYELLTEANIILRLAKNLDFNYNELYIAEIDSLFKNNCKFIADLIIKSERKEHYSKAIGYYKMSRISPKNIYESYLSNMKNQSVNQSCIHKANSMIGLTYTLKMMIIHFAKTRSESDFLYEIVKPILKKHLPKAINDGDLMDKKFNDLQKMYFSHKNTTVSFSFEIFTYFLIYKKNLLSLLGLKSIPFLDSNVQNYLKFFSLLENNESFNQYEILLYSLTLCRLKDYDNSLNKLEKLMTRSQLYLSLKYASNIIFDDNLNSTDKTREKTFSEFTEQILFRTNKTYLLDAISDVLLYFLCVEKRITITMLIELFVNYFALHVENCYTTERINLQSKSNIKNNILSINCIPRKIFETVLSGLCYTELASELFNDQNLTTTFDCMSGESMASRQPSSSLKLFSQISFKSAEIFGTYPKIYNTVDKFNKNDLSITPSVISSEIHLKVTNNKDNVENTIDINQIENIYPFENSYSEQAIIILMRLYLGNLAIATQQKYKVDNGIHVIEKNESLMIIRMQYIEELKILFDENKLKKIKWYKASNLGHFKNIVNFNVINNNLNNDSNNNINDQFNINYSNNNNFFQNKINKREIEKNMYSEKSDNFECNTNNCGDILNFDSNILPDYDAIKLVQRFGEKQTIINKNVDEFIRPIACLKERPTYLNLMEPFESNILYLNHFVGHSDEVLMWVLKIQCLLSSLYTNCILYEFILFIQKNPNLIGIDSFISILLPTSSCIKFLTLTCPEALYAFGKCYKLTNNEFTKIFRTLIIKTRELQSEMKNSTNFNENLQVKIKRYDKVLNGILDNLYSDCSFESFLNCLPIEEVSVFEKFIIRKKSDLSEFQNGSNRNSKIFHSTADDHDTYINAYEDLQDIFFIDGNVQLIALNDYVMDNVDETNLFQIFLRKCVAKQRIEALQAMIESTGKQLFEAAKSSQLSLN